MSAAPPWRSHVDGRRAAAVLVCAAAVYFAARKLVEGGSEAAAHNATRLMRFEQAIGIDVERSLQGFVLDHPVLVDWANHTYVWLHWPFLIFTFAVLFARDRRAYRHLRDTVMVSGAVGLIIFAVFPVSPPRFLPGFVGTVSQAERQHFLQYPGSWSNRFASLPSFHAGWTLVAAILLATTFRTTIFKIIALLPGPLVVLAVIVTGNHYVIDVIVGSLLSLAALTVVSRHIAAGYVRSRVHTAPAVLHSASRQRR